MQDRRSVEVANPRPGTPSHISRGRALEHCNNGIAYWTKDGRLRFRDLAPSYRAKSDVYITGVVNWRGSDELHTIHRPGEVRS